MKLISLLPADTYIVINKSIITEDDKRNMIALYEPIIGPIAVCLYFTLLRDIQVMDYISIKDYTHYHLMSVMKSGIEIIKLARESLEGVGLLKSYVKEGNANSYVYELYSPLSPKEFFASPIFNITLYNNLGKNEYELIKASYELPKVDIGDYEDISRTLDSTYKSSSCYTFFETKERNSLHITLESQIDFDLISSSFSDGMVRKGAFTKKVKDLINQLSFIYDIDTLVMIDLLREAVLDNGTFDTDKLRKKARKYYQYNNDGKLPTMVYRTQPEVLKSSNGAETIEEELIYFFENTSPSDFLKIKYNGGNPTSRDLQLIEMLWTDIGLQPGVINVLLDCVLRMNNNHLSKPLIESLASQWKMSNVVTVREAIQLAREERKKSKKSSSKGKVAKKGKMEEPEWLNQSIEKEEMTQDELQEMEELLSKFR